MKFKKLVYLFADILIVILCFYLATFLRYDGPIPAIDINNLLANISIAMLIVVVTSVLLGCYDSLWIYIGFEAFFKQILLSIVTVIILLIVKYTTHLTVSGSIAVIFGILLFIATTAIRGVPRFLRQVQRARVRRKEGVKRAVIVGAGHAGEMVIKRLVNEFDEQILPVAAIDDDTSKKGFKISGILVAGELSEIEAICKSYNADEIIIAIPSASKVELSKIYVKCAKTNLPIKTFQSVVDIDLFLQGNRTALKEIAFEDLLFRDTIETDMSKAKELFKDKVVMVTGGAGSIGSELCRQALEFNCKLLVVFDFNENMLYSLNEELKLEYDESRYRICLGSVRDFVRLESVMIEYKPQVLFHAAAHKHVPMMEINPFEAIKNNVMGTINVITACIQNNVLKFILISTDKAVNPPNIMGATKRIAELLVKTMNGQGCELAAVRFGNVLGSNGSVIPLFKKQIEVGGPVTVTHRDIERYFMTIPEAVRLVLTAGALANGGETFVLNMGTPIKIYDLACDLIKMSGLEPNVDIEIKVSGLRPGEKLTEELFLSKETVSNTSHGKVFVVKEDNCKLKDFEKNLQVVIELAKDESDEYALREAVFDLISN